ncbi:MAG: ferredoxin [Candidatus Eisenbacteria bacterium]|nr:ferredoxin [Candidatus Eisenbacteria bacterium]
MIGIIRKGNQILRVGVDQQRCDSSGVCVVELPQVFRFQEGSKKATVSMAEIPARLEQQCWEVARKCPTRAISITCCENDS